MKINLSASLNAQQQLARLRWSAYVLYFRIGRLPVVLAMLWLAGALYAWGVLHPELSMLQQRADEINRELRVPLPMVPAEQASLQQKLSAAQYQQVKALFAILNKNHLVIAESRYQSTAATERERAKLELDIPMNGTYRQLHRTLDELIASLPVKIAALTLARAHPDETKLRIILRVVLSVEDA